MISETTGISMLFVLLRLYAFPNSEQREVPVLVGSRQRNEQEEITMSKKEMTDNINFIAALEMLERLEDQGLLTSAEVERTKTELKRRLRPTLILV